VNSDIEDLTFRIDSSKDDFPLIFEFEFDISHDDLPIEMKWETIKYLNLKTALKYCIVLY
jgi:hypothetical protein